MPIDQQQLDQIVKHAQATYAKEVILNRAIPDLRDGLKPVHRRILYMAYKQGLLPTKRYMKSAKLSGLVLGLHPHGSSSVDGATVTLSQEWNLNVPLIDIHGSNGGVDGSGAAASRYIEARLTKPAQALLDDIHKNAVDLIDNYDATIQEPVILPAKWPVALTNGTSGIAVGMATNILPHNPLELMQGAIYLAQHRDATAEDLHQIILGPDFPTGGTIIGQAGVDEEFQTGRGRITVRGTAHIDEKQHRIVITEVPFSVTTTALKESIEKTLEDQTRALNITGADDESSDDVKIVIHFMKKATKDQMQTALNLLYQKSKLQINLSANNNLIWDHHPVQVGMLEYLKHFLKFRSQTLIRILKYNYQQAHHRLNLVVGFLKLIDLADAVTKVAKASDGRADFEAQLQRQFEFNPEQAKAIAGLPLYRLGRQDFTALQTEQTQLNQKLTKIQGILNSQSEFLAYLVRDLKATAQLFTDFKRRTPIVDANETKPVTIDQANLIKDQKVVVTIKPNGVIQRMSPQVYENNLNDYPDKDNLIQTLPARTTQGFVGLTKHGLSYFRFVDDLENQNIKVDVDPIQRDLPDYKSDDETLGGDVFDPNLPAGQRYILSVTATGMIKLMDEAKLRPNTNNQGYLKRTITYNGLRHVHDEVIKFFVLTEADRQSLHLVLDTNKKRSRQRTIVLKDLNVQGPAGSGQQTYKLDPTQDEVFTSITLVDPEQTEVTSEENPTNPVES